MILDLRFLNMGDTTNIRKGAVIRNNGDLYVVTFCQFVNPGKGSAFTKTKMKGISNGKTIEITFKSGESVDTVQVEYVNMQFLFKGPNSCSFMDNTTYETFEADNDLLGEDIKYLKDGLEVIMATFEDKIVAMQLPKKIQYTVKVAPPAVRGDTASGNVTKELVLDNDLIVYGPIFIKEGEEILVNTETGDYAGRVNE